MPDDTDLDRAAVERLLRTLDHAPPAVTAASVIARARARRTGTWRTRAAAALLLGAGLAGVAWAAPGSPLPRWISDARAALGARPAAEDPASAGETPADDAGIAVEPGSSLVIEFAISDTTSVAITALVDGSEVLVRAPAGAATFTSDARRLIVADVLPRTTIHVGIPRKAPRVELRAAGRRVFLKDGASVVTAVEPMATGVYRIRLGPLAP